MRNFKHVTNPCDKKVLPIITFARQSGMTWAAIAEELNIQGHPTPAMFRKNTNSAGSRRAGRSLRSTALPAATVSNKWPMALTLLIAVVFALVGSLAQADTSSSHETKDTKRYGNCVVFTEVDMFTDEVTHIFGCMEETLTDKTLIGMRSKKSGSIAYLVLSKGLQVHMEERIPVAIRVDKGPLIKRDAGWNSADAQTAYILDDEQLARQLLHDLAHGQRVAIQVGDERGNVRLNGSGKAVADFRQRAGL